MWHELRWQGIAAARCTVERLMRELGIAGAAAKRKRARTTVPGEAGQRPADLLDRGFSAPAPNRRLVADITYVGTACGFCHIAFVTDLFSRKIVGWQVTDYLRALISPWTRWRWRSSPRRTRWACTRLLRRLALAIDLNPP
ncbi:MAG: IS3 family transposase [Micromonosporaceae bacterium]